MIDLGYERYEPTLDGFANFCNDHKIPIVLRDVFADTHELENMGKIELWFFESHSNQIEEFLYYTMPIFLDIIKYKVPNQIELTQQKLLEYKEMNG